MRTRNEQTLEEVMIDKVKFMETLRAVADIARVTPQPLSKEEIMKYFDEMELSKEQQELVYQYILHPQEETVPEVQKEEQTEEENQSTEEKTVKEMVEGENSSQSKFFDMYMEEIGNLSQMTKDETKEAYVKLIHGDQGVIQPITDYWLPKVVELAKTYSKYKIPMEDLIQEGNIGLISGLQQLLGSKQWIDVSEYLKQSVQQSIEHYIDEVNSETDWESTVLAKMTLINEAKNVLTEETGSIPDQKKLSAYTKISEQEIEDILSLSLKEGK